MSSAAALKAWETRRARAAGILPAPAPKPAGASFVDRAAAARRAWVTIRANRARVATDAIAWEKLEAEREAWLVSAHTYTDLQPAFSDRPHARSYGADLPMRGLKFAGQKGRHSWPLTAEEKRATAAAPAVEPVLIRKGPHPHSYRPDLPLRTGPVSFALNAAEKRAAAARPVTIVPDVFVRATFVGVTCTQCGLTDRFVKGEKCPGIHRRPLVG